MSLMEDLYCMLSEMGTQQLLSATQFPALPESHHLTGNNKGGCAAKHTSRHYGQKCIGARKCAV